jgi:hypothetical protein
MDFHEVNVGELYEKLNHCKSSVDAVVRGRQKLAFTNWKFRGNNEVNVPQLFHCAFSVFT